LGVGVGGHQPICGAPAAPQLLVPEACVRADGALIELDRSKRKIVAQDRKIVAQDRWQARHEEPAVTLVGRATRGERWGRARGT
jgi:hypothetical protein